MTEIQAWREIVALTIDLQGNFHTHSSYSDNLAIIELLGFLGESALAVWMAGDSASVKYLTLRRYAQGRLETLSR